METEEGKQSKFTLKNILNILFIILILKSLVSGLSGSIYPPNIEVMNIEGVIQYSSKGNFKHTTDVLSGVALRAPKALIVRINSPGGTVGASQEIYDALKKVRKSGTKVVVLMEDVAASGGLYVAVAADKIVANPGTLTGSIGVIMQTTEYSKVLEWLHIKTNTIKSGKFKDTGSPNREMTEAERDLLQGIIQSTYEQFLSTVATERKIDPAVVRTFADGRIFNGAQAKEYGIVDEVGGFDVALRVAKELGGIPDGKEQIGYVDHHATFFETLSNGVSTGFNLDKLFSKSDLSGIPLYMMLN